LASILLVEDNPNIMKLNAEELIDHGYHVLCADNLFRAEELLTFHNVDLMLLDVMLPDGNGIEFCRDLKTRKDIPVIFLSALGENEDVINALRAGGEDYLTKPYSLDVLMARIEVQLRRKNSRRYITLGPLKMDTFSMTCHLQGRDAGLTRKEFAVLQVLISGRGRIISIEELYREIWGQDMNDDNQALRTVVSRLKKKLPEEEAGVAISYIRNEGYLLEHIGKN